MPTNEDIARHYAEAAGRLDLDAMSPSATRTGRRSGRSRASASSAATTTAGSSTYPGGHPTSEIERVVGAEDRWVVTAANTVQLIAGSGDFWWSEWKMTYPDGRRYYCVELIELRDRRSGARRSTGPSRSRRPTGDPAGSERRRGTAATVAAARPEAGSEGSRPADRGYDVRAAAVLGRSGVARRRPFVSRRLSRRSGEPGCRQRVRIDRDSPRLRRRRRAAPRRPARLILAATSWRRAGLGGVATNAFGPGALYQRLLSKIERFIAGPPPDRATLADGDGRRRSPRTAVAQPDADAGPAGQRPAAAPRRRRRRRRSRASPSTSTSWRSTARSSPTSSATTGARRPASRPPSRSSASARRPTPARREIAGRIREWESYADSHNGEWGPAAMALALDGLRRDGLPGRRVRDPGRRAADAAKAIARPTRRRSSSPGAAPTPG